MNIFLDVLQDTVSDSLHMLPFFGKTYGAMRTGIDTKLAKHAGTQIIFILDRKSVV